MPDDANFITGTTETGVPVSSQTISYVPNQGIATNATSGVVTDTNPNGRFFTEEDLNKARAQEKDKLYPQLDAFKKQIERLTAAEEAREAEIAQHAAEAAEAERKRLEDDMSVRDLLTQKEAEWEAKFAAAEAARAQAAALLDQEQRWQDLQAYKAERLAAEQNDIMPDLWDMVDGSTQEEIESSIARLKAKTSSILEAATSALQQNRMNMAGSRVTSPAAGPLDTESAHKTFSPTDIAGMSMNDYAKNRAALLGQAANQRNLGMFG